MLGGPLGALLGGALGHVYDKQRTVNGNFHNRPEQDDTPRVQAAFFTATFSVMGCVSKSDGHVSTEEIRAAEHVMTQMNLTAEQRYAAMRLFQQGKQPDFDLDSVIKQFSQECGRRRNLKYVFLEIQLQAAYADGYKHFSEQHILQHVCRLLGVQATVLQQLEAMMRFHQRQSKNSYERKAKPRDCAELQDAYSILGVSSTASDAEVKRSYRRLISRHHPDKLVSKGLPDEMLKIATEKTKDIQRAYDIIKSSRGASGQ